MFWKKAPRTTGSEHTAALSKTSDDWADEIERLSNELDEIAVTRATLTHEAGQAALDREDARATDLSDQLAKLNTREAIIRVAIQAGEARRADVEADEQRRRLTLKLRAYLGHVATWAEATAGVKDAEQALSAAVQAKRAAVAGLDIGDLYVELLGAGVTVVAVDDLAGSADVLRARAAEFRELATTAGLDSSGSVTSAGEVIDAGAIPLTEKQKQHADAVAAQPDILRRQRLAVVTSQLQDARRHEQRLAGYRTVHQQDRERAVERIGELEQERQALEAQGREVAA